MKLYFSGDYHNYSLHNHSNWSDGAGELETMCRAAKAAGVRVFGMSDHWVEPPEKEGYDSESWSMDLTKLDSYVASLLKLKAELDDDSFTLLLGLEVDFFFENIDQVLDRLNSYPLDYLIGSVHYSGTFPIDYSIDDWKDLSAGDIDDICRIYWEKLAGAAARKEFAFIGHLDLPKKFGMVENCRYLTEALKVLDILRTNGGAIELNTAGWFKECQEQYPSSAILQAAYARQIPVIISADAHHQDHVMRNFSEAEKVLQLIAGKN